MNPFTIRMLRLAAANADAARSIHPRNWRDMRRREKLNTCRRRGDKAKAIAGLTEHLLRHPTDAQSERHLAWLKGEAA
jgi:hypothetical protein